MSQISSTGSASNATLSAFFDHRHDAEDAVNRLIDAGIPRDSVRLVPGYENDAPAADRQDVHKGFFESLADFFMPDQDRYSYAEGLSRGGYLVTVTNIAGDRYDTALDILDDEGAINLDEREQSWRSEGWSGYAADTEPTSGYNDSTLTGGSTTGTYATGSSLGSTGSGLGTTGAGYAASGSTGYAGTTGSSLGNSDEEVIPVIEEELQIGKRDVNNGRVRVRSYVRETPVSEQVSLRDERVTIERRPVDRALSGTEAAFQDREIEAEEHIEQAVVSKEARVTEEIALRKDSEVRQETITDTVRSTEVEVEDERGTTSRTSGTGTFDRR